MMIFVSSAFQFCGSSFLRFVFVDERLTCWIGEQFAAQLAARVHAESRLRRPAEDANPRRAGCRRHVLTNHCLFFHSLL